MKGEKNIKDSWSNLGTYYVTRIPAFNGSMQLVYNENIDMKNVKAYFNLAEFQSKYKIETV